jgi:CBS domain-containing protein
MKTVRVRHTIEPSSATKTAMTVLCDERNESMRLSECFRCERFGWLEVDSLSDRLVLRCTESKARLEPCAPPSLDACLSRPLSALMTSKIFCVAPQTPYEVLAMLFMEREISAAPVVNADGRPIGLVSKTDLVRALFGHARPDGADWLIHGADSSAERLLRLAAAGAIEEGTAEGLMTPIPCTISESASFGDAIRTMSDNRYHHLIVVSSEGLTVGILSALDVVNIIAQNA